MSDDDTNGWNEYKRLVMSSIDRLTEEVRHERNNYKQGIAGVYERLIDVEKEIATLKVRRGIWGMMGGLIPVVTSILVSKL